MAQRFQDVLTGLILISGADPDAAITALPVLVIQAREDERIPTRMIEQYVAAAGPTTTYQLFEGDHFLLLKQNEQVQGAIVDWLNQQESQAK